MGAALKEFRGVTTSNTPGAAPVAGDYTSWQVNQFGVFLNTADSDLYLVFKTSTGIHSVKSANGVVDADLIKGINVSANIQTFLGAVDNVAARSALGVAYGTTSGTVAQGNDSRLSDARTPLTHATSHLPGGSDPIDFNLVGAVSTSRSIITTGSSLTGGGNLSADRTLAFVNDSLTPGNNYVYGTSASGVKGWYLATAILSGANVSLNKVTSSSTAGFLIEASNGTDVALFGAGPSATTTLYGGLNISGALTGVTTITASGTTIIGSDPGGSELLRVGGAIRAGASVFTGALSLSGGSASNGEVIGTGSNGLVLRADGTNKIANLIGGDGLAGATVACFGSAFGGGLGGGIGFYSSNGSSNTNRMFLYADGSIVLGTDPGGSELLRMSASARFARWISIHNNATVGTGPAMSNEAMTGYAVAAYNGSANPASMYHMVGGGAYGGLWVYSGGNMEGACASYYNGDGANGFSIHEVVFTGRPDNSNRKYHFGVTGAVLGTDPGGSELLRVGGAAKISGPVNATDLQVSGQSIYGRTNIWGGAQEFVVNTPAINDGSYAEGAIEIRTTDGSRPILGFHRSGYDAMALYTNGESQLRFRGSSGTDVAFVTDNIANIAGTVTSNAVLQGFIHTNAEGSIVTYVDNGNNYIRYSDAGTSQMYYAGMSVPAVVPPGDFYSITRFDGTSTYTELLKVSGNAVEVRSTNGIIVNKQAPTLYVSTTAGEALIGTSNGYPVDVYTNGAAMARFGIDKNCALGDTNLLSPAWKATAIGHSGYDKVAIGYLASSTNCATIGGHSSALNAWADIGIHGNTNVFIRMGETTVATFTAAGATIDGGVTVNASVGYYTGSQNVVIKAAGTGNTMSVIGGSDASKEAQVAIFGSAAGFNPGGMGFYTSIGGVAVETARIDTNTTAGQTRFMIWDVDNGTMERVSVGAADSGGTGYKLLRIPN